MSRVGERGQVTIPIELRRKHGIEPGMDVEFADGDDGIRITRASGAQTAAQRAIEAMRGRGDVKMSTDEIMALTRGEQR